MNEKREKTVENEDKNINVTACMSNNLNREKKASCPPKESMSEKQERESMTLREWVSEGFLKNLCEWTEKTQRLKQLEMSEQKV